MQSAAGGTSQRLNPAVAMISFAVKNIGKVAAPCERPINGRHALSPCYFARAALERATVSARTGESTTSFLIGRWFFQFCYSEPLS
jgi:hypothetical protein